MTQLILRSGRVHDDLNIRSAYRVCVALTYLLVAGLALSLANVAFLAAVVPIAAALYGLNWRFYRYFAVRRGLRFALAVVPVHLLYHLYNGLSFVVGSAIYLAHHHAGLRLPGALPLESWRRSDHLARDPRSESLPPRPFETAAAPKSQRSGQ